MSHIIKLLIIYLLFSVSHCAHPLDYFYKEIKKYGYIHYTTPLRYSGTGTLIGGSPSSMEIISHPHTCFPKVIGGRETNLRFKDEATLPNRQENYVINSDMHMDFFKIVSQGYPSIKAGFKMKKVKNLVVEFNGVHVEYIDNIRLVEFYRNSMPDICKDYLEYVGFIIQAIKVESLKFQLYSENGGLISLDLDNIKEYLDFSWDIDWKIEKGTELIITTPKYIGYQLGGLRKNSQGLSFWRSTSVKGNHWVFKHIGVYKNEYINSSEKYNPDARSFYRSLLDISMNKPWPAKY